VCCWWFVATRRRDAEDYEEPPSTLPRLEVVSGWSEDGGAQTSITGSWKLKSTSAPVIQRRK
jgi:hypothetical protein